MEYKIESSSDLIKLMQLFNFKKYDRKTIIEKFSTELKEELNHSCNSVVHNLNLVMNVSIRLHRSDIEKIETQFVMVTEVITLLSIQFWQRKTFIPDFFEIIETFYSNLMHFKNDFSISARPRQFFNTRLYDLIISYGIGHLLNNKFYEAEKCFVSALQEEINLFHTKNELYTLKKMLLLLVVETNIQRGYISFSEKILFDMENNNKVISLDLHFSYFRIVTELAEYYRVKNFSSAIYWYSKALLVFSQIKNQEGSKIYVSLIPEIKDFFKYDISLKQTIKEIKDKNSSIIKDELDKLNHPLIKYDIDKSTITLSNLVFSLTKQYLKKLKTPYKDPSFTIEKNKIVLLEVSDFDATILLDILSAIAYSNQTFLENRNYEALRCKDNTKISFPLLSTPIQGIESKIETDLSLKPKIKTRKRSSSNGNIKDQPQSKKLGNAESLGFDSKFNCYRIVSFYNNYIPEGIHYGFFDSSRVKKTDSKTLELHANLLYQKRKIVGKRESGIVFSKSGFKTKNCIDNFRMWGKIVDKKVVANYERILWSFSDPMTHEKQNKIYKTKSSK